jgi:hypothetical protein
MLFKSVKGYLQFKWFLLLVTTILLSFCIIFHVNASDDYSQTKETDNKFYILRLNYNFKENVLKLSNDAYLENLAIDNHNYTNDSGSNSQFYARVKDVSNQYEIFRNKKDRFYLGQWQQPIYFLDKIDKNGKMTSESTPLDKGDIKISVPYFYQGKTVEIYGAKTNKLALSIDVSKFAKVPLEKLIALHPELKQNNPPSETAPQTQENKTSKTSRWWLWLLLLIPPIIIGIFFFWRYRKNKEVL